MKKFTKEERALYFKNLRDKWQRNKELADKDETAKALHAEVGGNYSYYSFYFTLQSMRRQNIEGTPYIDCKTYKKWKEAGFQVKKGETSIIQGIKWMHSLDVDEEEEKSNFIYPKIYFLFHKEQVKELK